MNSMFLSKFYITLTVLSFFIGAILLIKINFAVANLLKPVVL